MWVRDLINQRLSSGVSLKEQRIYLAARMFTTDPLELELLPQGLLQPYG